MNPLTMYNTYLLVKPSENDIWVRRKSFCIARWSLPLFQNKIVGFGKSRSTVRFNNLTESQSQ